MSSISRSLMPAGRSSPGSFGASLRSVLPSSPDIGPPPSTDMTSKQRQPSFLPSLAVGERFSRSGGALTAVIEGGDHEGIQCQNRPAAADRNAAPPMVQLSARTVEVLAS